MSSTWGEGGEKIGAHVRENSGMETGEDDGGGSWRLLPYILAPSRRTHQIFTTYSGSLCPEEGELQHRGEKVKIE